VRKRRKSIEGDAELRSGPTLMPPPVLIEIHPKASWHPRAIQPAGSVAIGAGRAGCAACAGSRIISPRLLQMALADPAEIFAPRALCHATYPRRLP